MDKVQKLTYAVVLLLFVAIGVLAYSFDLRPVTSETVSTRYVTVPQTITIFTTTGTSRSLTTMTTFSYSVYGSGGRSCPYGGTYYASIYTSLCGWQYDVCVTFDYNCSNDYRAVNAMYTATYRLVTTSSSQIYAVQTLAASATSVLSLPETHTFTQPNPILQITQGLGVALVSLALAILLIAMLLLRRLGR